jgi:hypothetical protein
MYLRKRGIQGGLVQVYALRDRMMCLRKRGIQGGLVQVCASRNLIQGVHG